MYLTICLQKVNAMSAEKGSTFLTIFSKDLAKFLALGKCVPQGPGRKQMAHASTATEESLVKERRTLHKDLDKV